MKIEKSQNVLFTEGEATKANNTLINREKKYKKLNPKLIEKSIESVLLTLQDSCSYDIKESALFSLVSKALNIPEHNLKFSDFSRFEDKKLAKKLKRVKEDILEVLFSHAILQNCSNSNNRDSEELQEIWSKNYELLQSKINKLVTSMIIFDIEKSATKNSTNKFKRDF